eukprot:gene9121-16243_t
MTCLCDRYVILTKDFEKGYKTNVKKSDTEFDFYQYVILPKDFEKGYKTNVKKSDTEFDFYQ